MYVRTVKGKELNLSVYGKLWQRSLIMEDDETGTEWSHIMGKAMAGELKGSQLEVIPSVITDWKSWRARHPRTSVMDLPRTDERFVREYQRRRPENFVLGLSKLGRAKAYSFVTLKKEQLVQDTFEGDPIVVAYLPEAATATAFYRRTTKGKALNFAPGVTRQTLTDKETGSRWDALSGKGLSGPLKGEALELAPGIPSFREAWEKFYPDSEFR